jgi:hypothetical protein
MDMKHHAKGRDDPMDAKQPRTPIEPASGQVPNAGQREQWAREGAQWVAEADRYDTMFQPFGEAVLAAASLAPGERVADVGCGNGALTIDAARRVGPTGMALGIDISTPMLDLARRRATQAGVGNVEFVEADAQVHPFGGGSLDAGERIVEMTLPIELSGCGQECNVSAGEPGLSRQQGMRWPRPGRMRALGARGCVVAMPRVRRSGQGGYGRAERWAGGGWP